jgi:phospholipase/carboxylesterase
MSGGGGGDRPRAMVVLHGYEDPPGRRRVVAPDDPSWHLVEPRGPVELAGGPAWFATDEDGPVDAQLRASVRQVQAALTEAAVGSAGSVILGGFSQGGAVALASALATSEDAHPTLTGVFCVNGWLPHAPALAYDPSVLATPGTRVLVVASAEDEVVLVQQGRSAARWLERAAVHVDYVELPGGHGIGPDAVAAVVTWLDGLAEADIAG